MDVGSGAARGPPEFLFLYNDIDKVERGLMLLFFGLVFFRCPPPPQV